jgi:hypothetical protein
MHALFYMMVYPKIINHHSSIIIHQSSFIIHHSSFIIHHSSFIIHHSSLKKAPLDAKPLFGSNRVLPVMPGHCLRTCFDRHI